VREAFDADTQESGLRIDHVLTPFFSQKLSNLFFLNLFIIFSPFFFDQEAFSPLGDRRPQSHS